MQEFDTTNSAELLFFTNMHNVYKAKVAQFGDSKASLLGDYIPVALKFSEGETVVRMAVMQNYSGCLLFVYKNGKVAKVPLESYQTKTNRKMLQNAYSDKEELVEILDVGEGADVMLRSSNGRAILFNTGMILPKTTKNTIGVQAMALKAKGSTVDSAVIITEEKAKELSKYRTKTLPAAGPFAKDLEDPNQYTL